MRTTTITPSVYYFGTPVTLISTLSADGSTNISPISSSWALGDTYALGMSAYGHGAANLRRTRELVINLPDATLTGSIERIAPTTGAPEVPAHKRERFRFEPDKWTLGGFTPLASETVRPARIAQCPVQIEAEVSAITPLDAEGEALVVHAHVRRVHVHEGLAVPGTNHIDLDRWRPVYYTFRHYFAQGDDVGTNFRAEQ